MTEWYDAVDTNPRLVCEIEEASGQRCEAIFVMGTWETLEGEAVYPVRWRPLYTAVARPLYKWTPPGED